MEGLAALHALYVRLRKHGTNRRYRFATSDSDRRFHRGYRRLHDYSMDRALLSRLVGWNSCVAWPRRNLRQAFRSQGQPLHGDAFHVPAV